MTARLAATAAHHWHDLDGWAITHGVDLLALPPGRYYSVVWQWITRHVQEQTDYDRLDADLWRPPPGVAATEGPWSPEAETAGFAALRESLG